MNRPLHAKFDFDVSTIKARGRRVVVLPDMPKEVTSGGIILAHQSITPHATGTVISAGPGVAIEVMDLRPRDRVVFPNHSGLYFKAMRDGKEVDILIMQQNEVLFTIQDDAEIPDWIQDWDASNVPPHWSKLLSDASREDAVFSEEVNLLS